jgi:hypothetical protein
MLVVPRRKLPWLRKRSIHPPNTITMPQRNMSWRRITTDRRRITTIMKRRLKDVGLVEESPFTV